MGKPFDRNNAPDGCYAEPAGDRGCWSCCFIGETCTMKRGCLAELRPDRTDVIYKCARVEATASWPCDDMGTPVEVVS